MNTFRVTLEVRMTDEQVIDYAKYEAEHNDVDAIPEHLAEYIAECAGSLSNVVGTNTTSVVLVRHTRFSGIKAWVRRKVSEIHMW